MTINDRLTVMHEYFDGSNIEPNSIAYWNGFPVVHDTGKSEGE